MQFGAVLSKKQGTFASTSTHPCKKYENKGFWICILLKTEPNHMIQVVKWNFENSGQDGEWKILCNI